MINSYIKMFKDYAVFSGRSTLGDFWWAMLANVIVSIILGIIVRVVPSLRWITAVYGLAIALPSIALCVRRLHDVGKSGWYYLIGFIPIVGGILLLIDFLKPSVPNNQY
ncbi:MAG: hypothetical protein K0S71_1069 [Clostridia bacterium]|jgi:uncharacterized membrane protein YhaH (DUF805 family)|nr:hypothetical protein [Clostridia bacterium]